MKKINQSQLKILVEAVEEGEDVVEVGELRGGVTQDKSTILLLLLLPI